MVVKMCHQSFARLGFFTLLLLVSTCSVGAETVPDPLESDFGRVVHASLIFRHGDRNPQNTYPNDPYKNYPWKEGLGGLNDVGKRRLVELGRWFKKHYQNVIDEKYSPKQIRIDSSGIDRTIMSAQCFLFGFYPTTDREKWLGNEQWQPIPIHTIEPKQDNIIVNLKNCDMYNKQMEEAFFPIYEQFKDVIHYIEIQAGLNFEGSRMEHIFYVLEKLEDAFLIYREYNFTLPSWASEIFPEPLQTILSKTQRDETFTTKTIRFTSGLLFRSIILDMQRKIRGDKFEEVLHLYSGHDSTIRRCLTALQVFDDQRVPYGATVIIELRRKENTSYYVTVSLKNETDGSPHVLQIPGCAGLNCSFHQFENLTSTLVPNDWEKECEVPTSLFRTLCYFATGHWSKRLCSSQ